MDKALLSSNKMGWCTPKDFFDDLNREFHFVLDAAATDKTAKCPEYFTPETDGLSQSWDIGGRYFVTHHTGERSASGFKRHIRSIFRE